MKLLRRKLRTWLLYTPVTIAAVAALLPLYWLLTGAIKPAGSLLSMPPELVPRQITFSHIVRLFEGKPAGWWLFNSVVAATVATVVNVVLCALAGYGFAKLRFPGREVLFWLCLGTMMVPMQVTVIPLFLMVRSMGLINTYTGLVLPTLVTAFGIFLMRQYILAIPDSLLEAARIDGGSEPMIFCRIIFPLVAPAATVLAILSFTTNWNNFLWPLVVMVDDDKWTMPVGIASLNDDMFSDYGVLMAAAALAAVPMIVLFIALQRFMLKGLMLGAVKE